MLTAVETWLKGRPGTLADHEAPEPKLAKGEDVLSALDRVRCRVRELKADLHRVRSAPYPSAHARKRLREEIEALAQRGAPSVSRLVEHDGEISWPTQQMMVAIHNAQPGAVGFVEVLDAAAMFAWLHRETLLKNIIFEIETPLALIWSPTATASFLPL